MSVCTCVGYAIVHRHWFTTTESISRVYMVNRERQRMPRTGRVANNCGSPGGHPHQTDTIARARPPSGSHDARRMCSAHPGSRFSFFDSVNRIQPATQSRRTKSHARSRQRLERLSLGCSNLIMYPVFWQGR